MNAITIRTLFFASLSASALALAFAGCAPPPDDGNLTEDTSVGPQDTFQEEVSLTDTSAPPEDVIIDTSEPPLPDPSLTVGEQNLELSTVLTVEYVDADGPGFVVVHDDDAGDPGEVLGWSFVNEGESHMVAVHLSRPLEDGELVHVMLHNDADEGFVLDPNDDPVVTQEGELLVESVVVDVASSVPAARIFMSVADGAYQLDGVEPELTYAFEGTESEKSAPTLSLRAGWRYELVNVAASAHPIELLTIRSDGADVVLLSQNDGGGYLEDDPTVNFEHNGDSLTFTVSSGLASEVSGYRCNLHRETMRGDIVIVH